VKGLGHVAIYVRDLERMVEFYRDLLGTHHQAELARRRRISKRRSGERGS
jgi:catechol 2,3-dioxygenase-like lactoylglutathione lyase family enzyme